MRSRHYEKSFKQPADSPYRTEFRVPQKRAGGKCSLARKSHQLTAAAQEWGRFRGPNGTGISPAKGLPVSWKEDDYEWRVSLPGIAHSQPVVWGNRVFASSASADGQKRILRCHDTASGDEDEPG